MGDNKGSLAALNDQLLAPEPDANAGPKRGSKDDLISKILKLHEEQDVPLEYSNTKLKRMSKKELAGVLGAMLQQAATSEMARQVGADPSTATNGTIALGALRMVHDMAAGLTERLCDPVARGYGYTVHGFKEALTDPSVREATDACLAEIAQDSDVLAYIESPWSRLGLAWMGAAMSVARRAPKLQDPDDTISQGNGKYGAAVRFGPLRRQHPAPVGPEEADEKDPV